MIATERSARMLDGFTTVIVWSSWSSEAILSNADFLKMERFISVSSVLKILKIVQNKCHSKSALPKMQVLIQKILELFKGFFHHDFCV